MDRRADWKGASGLNLGMQVVLVLPDRLGLGLGCHYNNNNNIFAIVQSTVSGFLKDSNTNFFTKKSWRLESERTRMRGKRNHKFDTIHQTITLQYILNIGLACCSRWSTGHQVCLLGFPVYVCVRKELPTYFILDGSFCYVSQLQNTSRILSILSHYTTRLSAYKQILVEKHIGKSISKANLIFCLSVIPKQNIWKP